MWPFKKEPEQVATEPQALALPQEIHVCLHVPKHENDGSEVVQAIINFLVIVVLLMTILYYIRAWKNQ
jgi:hypothetical protein